MKAIIAPPTLDERLTGDKIKVTRPDPATGEVTQEIVGQDAIRPKQPTRPTLIESRRVSPCSVGWSINYMHDHRERLIAFWEAHASCLTREEKSDLSNERSTSVLRPAELVPAWKIGDRLQVANNVEAEVLQMDTTYRGHGTVFRVHDHRPWLMKQTVGGSSKPRTDRHGYAIEPTQAAKEAARVDGNYTRSAAQAVPNSGDVIDDSLHGRLHAEAAMGNALSGSHRRVRASKMQIEQRLADARKKNRRSTVKMLERKLGALHKRPERDIGSQP